MTLEFTTSFEEDQVNPLFGLTIDTDRRELFLEKLPDPENGAAKVPPKTFAYMLRSALDDGYVSLETKSAG